MKTKNFFLPLILIASTTSLFSQTTREQADAIVLNHIQNEAIPLYDLYVNVNAPSATGIAVTMSTGETVKARYACWIYYLSEDKSPKSRYLFVKENNGSLLEIIANNDLGPNDLASWEVVSLPTGFSVEETTVNQSLYPNPVDDWLTLPCTEEHSRVEIYDLKGIRLFSGTLSDNDTCRLNVSFLSAGIYLVNIGGETYKIIKN